MQTTSKDWVLHDLQEYHEALAREERGEWLGSGERPRDCWESLVGSCGMESAAPYRDQLAEKSKGSKVFGPYEDSWTNWILYTYPKEWDTDLAEAVACAKSQFWPHYNGPGLSFAGRPRAHAQNGRVLVKQSGGLDI